MDKLFLDSDLIIDVLAERPGFYDSAATLLSLAEKNRIKCFTSPIVIANIYYVISKVRSKDFAKRSVSKLKNYVEITNVDQKIIDLALESNFSDLKDAIQYYCALEIGADILVTRNKKDYLRSKIPVLSPREYLDQKI